MHRILRGTFLVFIKKVYMFEILEFLGKHFKNVKNISTTTSQKCYGRWFGGSTWRSTV